MSCALTTAALVFLLPSSATQWQIEADRPTQSQADTGDLQTTERLNEAKLLLRDLSMDLDDRILRSNVKAASAQLEETSASKISDISGSWMNVFLLLVVPVYTVISFLFFYRSHFLLPEHVAIHSFIVGFQNLLSVATIPFAYLGLFGGAMVVYSVISLCYQFWVWKRIFARPGVMGVILCLEGITVGFLGFLLIQGALAVLILYIQTS